LIPPQKAPSRVPKNKRKIRGRIKIAPQTKYITKARRIVVTIITVATASVLHTSGVYQPDRRRL